MSWIEYETVHERFKTFLNLAGIHVTDGKIVKYGENKKDYLRGLQFESSDTLIMYLRFLLWIRSGWTPYLPDVEDENREEKGSVINYYEAKHVWLALINETSYEHGLNEDSFKELDVICDQFLEDAAANAKKNTFKIPANVLAKTNLKENRKESDNDLK